MNNLLTEKSSIPQNEQAYVFPTSASPQEKDVIREILYGTAEVGLIGYEIYHGVRFVRNLGWMTNSVIWPTACFGIGFWAVNKTIGVYQAIIYRTICCIVGSSKNASCTIEQSRGIDHLRVRYWKIMVSLEGLVQKLDRIFCQVISKCGFKIRPIHQVNCLKEQRLTTCEIVRKAFGMALGSVIKQQVRLQVTAACLRQLNIYWIFNPQSFLWLAEGSFVFYAIKSIQKIKQDIAKQNEANDNLFKFAYERGYTLRTQHVIDLKFCSYLNPIFLEKLLIECPQLELILMHLSDLEKAQGINVLVRKSAQVQLDSFRSFYGLWNNEKIKDLAQNLATKYFTFSNGTRKPIHEAVIARFLCLNLGKKEKIAQIFFDQGKLKDLDLLKPGQEREEVEHWLTLIYSGMFPLFRLNEVNPDLFELQNMVDHPEYSDFTFIFKEEKSIAAHQIFLIKFRYFTQLIRQQQSDSSQNSKTIQLDCSKWSRKTVLKIVECLYNNSTLNFNSTDNLSEALEILRTWKLDKLKVVVEQALINYVNRVLTITEVNRIYEMAHTNFLGALEQVCLKRKKQLTESINRFKKIEAASWKSKLQHLENVIKKHVEDFSLVIGNEKLAVHSMWLVLLSPYFKRLLNRNPECKELDCSMYNHETVKQVFQFIYTGKCDCKAKFFDYSQLFDLAHRWELKDLKAFLLEKSWFKRDLEKFYLNQLNATISLDKIKTILIVAREYQMYKVLQESMRMIQELPHLPKFQAVFELTLSEENRFLLQE